MIYEVVKVLLSAGVIVAVSQLAKTNVTLGALVNSLPIVSIMAMLWLYTDTRDVEKIAALSTNTFWLVLPTLPMFLVLPWLLRRGVGFPAALASACLLTVVLAALTVIALRRLGIDAG